MSNSLQPSTQAPSSPSKSSLRRVSGPGATSKTFNNKSPSPGPTTHFASEATQHHFLLHSPPNQALDYEEEEDDELNYEDDGSYQPASQPRLPLQPFFALIEDTTTNEHFHPTVHYIFADDEPDIITEAACRSIEQEDPSQRDQSQSQTRNPDEEAQSENRLPPSRPGIKEHYIILDVHPTPAILSTPTQQLSDRLPSPSPSSVETAQALHSTTKTYPYTITSAQSLSADWQVFRTTITDAPTMNAEQQSTDEQQHLMLRIEGRGNSPDKLIQRKEGETMEDMIAHFQTRLSEIRHLIMDSGVEERDAAAAASAAEADGEDNMFTTTGEGLVGIGFQPTGFGNAILDEQD